MSDTPVMSPLLKHLGLVPYEPTWRAMQRFTDERGEHVRDEIWFLEHSPVFTLGMNGKPEHVLAAGDIPVVQIDRGGQVTYHGPGQLVVYPLLDLRRHQMTVRELVMALETAIINTVANWGIKAEASRSAPGVYVEGRKLASVGLRIRRGCVYHGLAFNVGMDLQPFQRINPCGYQGLEVVDLAALGVVRSVQQVAQTMAPKLCESLRLPPPVEWSSTVTAIPAHTR
ncbi:MAG: lipoyl(octanoyl) transferase LipB [Steroidobacteraceae bacterium]